MCFRRLGHLQVDKKNIQNNRNVNYNIEIRNLTFQVFCIFLYLMEDGLVGRKVL